MKSYAERIDIDSGAGIGGDLSVMVRETKRGCRWRTAPPFPAPRDLKTWPKQPSRYLTIDYYIGQTLSFLAAFVTGLVLFYLFPEPAYTSARQMVTRYS